jgi:hypothetical protein
MKYALLSLAIIFIPLGFLNAQVGSSLVNQQLTIDTNPVTPEPLSNVKASINDYSLPFTVSGVSWKINGVSLPEADNLRSINFKTGEAGSKTTLEATVSLGSGATLSTTKTITPAYLDIIVEPLTRTPSFYRGRGLPSVGSRVNLTALINGLEASPSSLIYTWRVNNNVIEGGSLRGKNKVTMTTPLGQRFILSVDVTNLDGTTVARKTTEVMTATPEVHFYEVTTLQGMKPRSLTKGFSLISDSSTIQAEPYNLDLSTYNNPDFLEWKIGGQRTEAVSVNPYQITLSRLGVGAANVGFHVRDLTQLLQGARGEFQVNF